MRRHVPCFLVGGLDEPNAQAYLFFEQNRTIYRYDNVTNAIWQQIIYAVQRRGTGFNVQIRALPGTYPFTKLDAVPPGLTLTFVWNFGGFYEDF